MTKLKLGPLPDDKPVKVTVKLSSSTTSNQTAYWTSHSRVQTQSTAAT